MTKFVKATKICEHFMTSAVDDFTRKIAEFLHYNSPITFNVKMYF